MAMIICTECGAQISAMAENCPHCGVQTIRGRTVEESKSLSVRHTAAFMLMLIGLWLFLDNLRIAVECLVIRGADWFTVCTVEEIEVVVKFLLSIALILVSVVDGIVLRCKSRRLQKRALVRWVPSEPVSRPAGDWQCECGRTNRPYVTACVCGRSKLDAHPNQQPEPEDDGFEFCPQCGAVHPVEDKFCRSCGNKLY